MRPNVLISLIFMIQFMGILSDGCRNNPEEDKWVHFLGQHPEKYWQVSIGAPHSSVTDLDFISPSSDGTNAEPLGLNPDPKNVFSFEKSGNETLLHISGEIYGALTSKKEYSKYHLQLQYKWGDLKWEPRLVCVGDISLHIVNGKVVMALYNPKIQERSSQIVPLRKGRIQIQSEGAKIFDKDIKIRYI